MTNHTPDAGNWRHLTDQLTPRQVTRLSEVEQRSTPSETAAALLRTARYWAANHAYPTSDGGVCTPMTHHMPTVDDPAEIVLPAARVELRELMEGVRISDPAERRRNGRSLHR